VKAPDNLVIYFAGHGEADGPRGYWIPHDGLAKGQRGHQASWILTNELITYLDDCQARHIFLLVDSCFSAALLRDLRDAGPALKNLATDFGNPSRLALTSGALEPVSDGSAGGHSPFATCLINRLLTHPGPHLRASELCQAVAQQVGTYEHQRPQSGIVNELWRPYIGRDKGDFVFFRRDTDGAAWLRAAQTDTVAAYEAFLLAHPASAHAPQARARLAELAQLAAAEAQQRADEYRELYETFFADGLINDRERRLLAAKQRDTRLTDAQVRQIEGEVQETTAWQAAQQADTEEAYLGYLRTYPSGPQADQADLRLRELWAAALAQKQAEAEKLRLEKLAEEQRKKEEEEKARRQKAEAAERERQAEEAEKIRLEKLAEEERLQKEKEAAEAEETTWQAAQQAGSEAAYFAYTTKYPYGRYFNQANDQIRRIRAQRDAQAAQRRHEEAEYRFGLAKAQRDAGLLRDLVARYPESPVVPQAQALLAELEAETATSGPTPGPHTGTPTGGQTDGSFPKKWLLPASLSAVVLVAVLLFTFRDKIFGNGQTTDQTKKNQSGQVVVPEKQLLDTAGPPSGDQGGKTDEEKLGQQEKPVPELGNSPSGPVTNVDVEEKDWQGLGKPEKINLEQLEKFLDKHSKGRRAAQARTLRDKLRGRYQKALQNGDASYALEDYANAVKYFRAALALKPNDTKLRERILAVEELQKPDY
jgi:chemotaxis protein histidine kinase CheA